MRLISRALAVMNELCTEPTGLTLQELSQRTDVPVGSMHRLLSVLTEEHFVVRATDTRRYFVGPSALAVGAAAAHGTRLHQTPPAKLTQVADQLDETLFLSEMVGSTRAVCVAIAYGRRLTPSPILLGEELLIGASPATRVLLMEMRDQYVVDLLARTLPAPLPTQRAAAGRVKTIRKVGYDIGDGEPAAGLWTLSVPLRSSGGRVFQSLSVITTTQRGQRARTRSELMGALCELAKLFSPRGPHPAPPSASRPRTAEPWKTQRAGPYVRPQLNPVPVPSSGVR